MVNSVTLGLEEKNTLAQNFSELGALLVRFANATQPELVNNQGRAFYCTPSEYLGKAKKMYELAALLSGDPVAIETLEQTRLQLNDSVLNEVVSTEAVLETIVNGAVRPHNPNVLTEDEKNKLANLAIANGKFFLGLADKKDIELIEILAKNGNSYLYGKKEVLEISVEQLLMAVMLRGNVEDYFSLGRTRSNLADKLNGEDKAFMYHRAEEDLKIAVSLDNDNWLYHNWLGATQSCLADTLSGDQKVSKYKEAIGNLSRAIELTKKQRKERSSSNHYWRGITKVKLAREVSGTERASLYSGVIYDLRKSIHIKDPQTKNTWYNYDWLGLAYKELMEDAITPTQKRKLANRAIASFTKALELCDKKKDKDTIMERINEVESWVRYL